MWACEDQRTVTQLAKLGSNPYLKLGPCTLHCASHNCAERREPGHELNQDRFAAPKHRRGE
jgi:hypothetical protein